MSNSKLVLVVGCTLLGMVLVAWLGYEYRNETVAFLRALVRAL
jgi:hypothetical protein